MRGARRAGLLLLAGLPLASPGAAQQRVQVTVDLRPAAVEGAPPTPRVSTRHLAADPRWLRVLEDQIPVRLRYRLELWRSRALNDALERPTEWEVLLRIEPLYDQYSLTVINRGLITTERRASTVAELDGVLAQGFDVPVLPRAPGVYYYTVTLAITPLSDSEMADYERFLQGDQAATGGNQTSSIGRTTRRLLLRIAGLPTTEIDGRSDRFTVTRIPE